VSSPCARAAGPWSCPTGWWPRSPSRSAARGRARTPSPSPPPCALPATTSSWPWASCSPRASSTAPPTCTRSSTASCPTTPSSCTTWSPSNSAVPATSRPGAASPRRVAASAAPHSWTSSRTVARSCLPALPRSVLLQLPDRVREGQQLFDRTGGLHAAGLFDLDGTLLSIREDVGRHNAVDKLVGEAVLAGHLPLRERVLVVSGRVGYELVQKAAVAGIPMLAAVSAPSSLAVETGRRLGVCVAGFVRPPTANIYSHPERVDLDR